MAVMPLVDISPELLDRVRKKFNELMDGDGKAKSLVEKIKKGATYAEVNDYSIRVGDNLGKAFAVITGEDLPSGKMYYNIAQKVVAPMLEGNYNLVSAMAQIAQKSMNDAAGIGINAIVPPVNRDKINGICQHIADAEAYEETAWILREPVTNFTQSIVDEFVKANAEFQYESGMSPKLVRTVVGNCCDWCRNLAGVFDYEDAPDNIYRRHEYCRCTVEYMPDKKRRVNVWTKKWRDSTDEKIQARKKL